MKLANTPLCNDCKRHNERERGCKTCARITAEKRWIRKLVRAAIQQNMHVAVDYMEGDAPIFMSAERTIMDMVGACDEEKLRIRFPDRTTGAVLLVYGNADDGSEIFSDWSMNVDPLVNSINYLEA